MTLPLFFSGGSGLMPIADDPYGFTIPNPEDPTYPFPWQSRWTQTDIDILHYGLGRGDALTGGGQVTAHATVDFGVAIAQFTGQLRGASYSGIASNLTPDPADPTYPRVDLVISNSSGNLSMVTGTPWRSPLPPAFPGGGTAVCHAMVTIPAGATKLYQGYIVDKRVLLRTPITPRQLLVGTLAASSVSASSTNYFVLGGSGLYASTEPPSQIPATFAGTVRNLYFTVISAQPGSGSLVATLRKNGADTALSATITAGSFGATATDLTHSVTIAAGDLLALKVVNNASGASGLITSYVVEIDPS